MDREGTKRNMIIGNWVLEKSLTSLSLNSRVANDKGYLVLSSDSSYVKVDL